jgi:histidinol-phosphate/aromatic aminotransferase/cobyric acid decarboxylase-like protein
MRRIRFVGAFHGGAFWQEYGTNFERFSDSEAIPADVLDAWFPPAPGVVEALVAEIPRLARTSPPANAEGLIGCIAKARSTPSESIAVGAGSSSLIYQLLPKLIRAGQSALVYDPIYGEYPHVLDLIGARICRAGSLPEFARRLECL